MAKKRRPIKSPPIERFPMRPRADGRFQKRIHGKLFYFGFGGDRVGAMAEYDRVKHDLYAGRIPREAIAAGQTTLKVVAQRYAVERDAEAEAGRLDAHWNGQCVRAIDRFGKRIGGSRFIDDLLPEDFAAYGRWLSQQLGSHAYNRERESIVTMFRHAYECGWIDRPMRFGKGFAKVPAAVIREQRAFRLVDNQSIALILGTAPIQIEAMLLLAINCGFGATDCSILEWDRVDLDDRLIRNFRRPKTSIDRDSPLWVETVEALREVRSGSSNVFRTKRGVPWSGEAVAHRVSDVVEAINAGRSVPLDFSMGDLRHTFATYANETGDTDAVKRIMGHSLPGLKSVYVETLFIPRLRKVVDHVRERVLVKPSH